MEFNWKHIAGLIVAGLIGWGISYFTAGVDRAIAAADEDKISKSAVVVGLNGSVEANSEQIADLKEIAATLANNQATLIKNQDRIYDAIVQGN